MSRRHLAGLILASALITLDGTATTIALPAIGRELSAPIARLQWITNAPLLVLAVMLLPAGAVVDRFGRVRMMRAGLLTFVAGAAASSVAPSDEVLIALRLATGAAGALMLPTALAALRSAYTDDAERTRIFGAWAAWTGVASAVGPLLAGALVDLMSWRAVFVASGLGGVIALLLLAQDTPAAIEPRSSPLPVASALRELRRSRNCFPANTATFALYFGMFGLSFLLAIYVQQVLRYSALRAAVVLLPISILLFFAERFGRLAGLAGTRLLIVAGAAIGAAAIGWLATGPQPLPFWSRIIAGTAAFGLGISLAVSAITHVAVAGVPDNCAGAASGLNHAVVRVAGLVAVALLGALAAPGASDAITAEGFRRAMLVCAAVVAVIGIAGAMFVRDDEPGGLESEVT